MASFLSAIGGSSVLLSLPLELALVSSMVPDPLVCGAYRVFVAIMGLYVLGPNSLSSVDRLNRSKCHIRSPPTKGKCLGLPPPLVVSFSDLTCWV